MPPNPHPLAALADRVERESDRPYEHRCATCGHNQWQNEAVGDCGIFNKDVLHHDITPCQFYGARAAASGAERG